MKWQKLFIHRISKCRHLNIVDSSKIKQATIGGITIRLSLFITTSNFQCLEILSIFQFRVVFLYHLCPAVHSCRCDCKLLIHSRLLFLALISTLTCSFSPSRTTKVRDDIQNLILTNVLRRQGHLKYLFAVMVNFRSPLQAGIACQGDM